MVRTFQRGLDERLTHQRVGRQWLGTLGVLVHHARHLLLVKTAPVDADPYRLAILDRGLDHGGELLVTPRPLADIARIDAVLGQCFGAFRVLCQQLVAVVVEITDQRHITAQSIESATNGRHLRGRLWRIDGDADDLRTSLPELIHLLYGGIDIGRVGIGHRLYDHGRPATDRYMADHGLQAVAACDG